jgi:hypothetical protein
VNVVFGSKYANVDAHPCCPATYRRRAAAASVKRGQLPMLSDEHADFARSFFHFG